MIAPVTLTRRQFLHGTTVAVAGASLGALDLRRAFAAGPASAPSRIDKPMRWAQLTKVEDDPGKFDPQFWLDYFRRTKSDAVCLSAGGCVAYYPTKVPFHQMMKGPIRELIPVGPQQFRVRLPKGARPRRVHLLAADQTPKVKQSGRHLTLTVSSILDHEVVAIDL